MAVQADGLKMTLQSVLVGIQSFLATNITLILLFGTAIAGIFAWWLNEWAKRSSQEHDQREERYVELIKGYRGCYQPVDKNLQKKFIDELNLSWLHCPDEVIRKGNNFLEAANTSANAEDIDKAASEFMLTIRKDALRKWPWPIQRRTTELEPDAFRAWRPLRIIQLSGTIHSGSSMQANVTISKKEKAEGKKHWWQFCK